MRIANYLQGFEQPPRQANVSKGSVLPSSQPGRRIFMLLKTSSSALNCGAVSYCARNAWVTMLRITDLEKQGRKRWCTAVVLVAVCAITVSVATRYCFSPGPSGPVVKIVQKHSSSEPGVQRLLNNAATWMPPVVGSAILQQPAYFPQVAPSGASISTVLLEKNLYNRPPPSLLFYLS